ncbi:hypothetical protein J6590_066248 [Homalodisca vitripennis]|nr:hypothetical protein J6590_066248 [Homalodisca vitripennis]
MQAARLKYIAVHRSLSLEPVLPQKRGWDLRLVTLHGLLIPSTSFNGFTSVAFFAEISFSSYRMGEESVLRRRRPSRSVYRGVHNIGTVTMHVITGDTGVDQALIWLRVIVVAVARKVSESRSRQLRPPSSPRAAQRRSGKSAGMFSHWPASRLNPEARRTH